MANMNERIESLVDHKLGEVLDLFQDYDDRTNDLLPYLQKLISALPLISDIKTEVADIQKMLAGKPEEDDEEEDEKKKRKNRPDKPEEIEYDRPDLLEKLGDLLDNVLDGKPYLELPGPSDPFALPDPFGNGGSGPTSGFDWLKLLSWINKKFKQLDNAVIDKLSTKKAAADLEKIKEKLIFTETTLTMLENDFKKKINEVLEEIRNRTSDLADQIEQCCTNTGDKLDAVHQSVEDVKRSVQGLNPQQSHNQELAIEMGTKRIFGEVDFIRRLL